MTNRPSRAKRLLLNIPLCALAALACLCAGAGVFERLMDVSATQTDLSARFLSPAFPHMLGTDALGRDVLMRLLYGGRISLIVAAAASVTAAVIGTVIGLAAGWRGGAWDAVLMRLTDMLIALPALPLLIILSALDLEKIGLVGFASAQGASLYKITAIIALLGWTTVARLVRARTLSLKHADYVLAARALGLSGFALARRHILPNVQDTVLVATALAAGNVILTESVLSFLGLGIQPPMPSWGNMLSTAQDLIWSHAALAVYPGVLIFATVLAFNFLGDALQDALDPKTKSL